MEIYWCVAFRALVAYIAAYDVHFSSFVVRSNLHVLLWVQYPFAKQPLLPGIEATNTIELSQAVQGDNKMTGSFVVTQTTA